MPKLIADTDAPRLDQFLAQHLSQISRSKIKTLIDQGQILVNQSPAKPKQSVSLGDCIQVPDPSTHTGSAPTTPRAEPIPLSILFEDAHLVVVNKPPGLVVHPANGNETGTLVNALLHHCQGQLAPAPGQQRPGIVHRLDKDTSGCIVAAKTNHAYHSLNQQFSQRLTDKRYFALAQGEFCKRQGTVFTNIGRHPVKRQKMAVVEPPAGKTAITDYEVISYDTNTDASLVCCTLHTGRTHQIRVHLSHLGHPIIGDPIYAKPTRQKAQPGRLMLHAWQLGFQHPVDATPMLFSAELPAEFHYWTQRATPHTG